MKLSTVILYELFEINRRIDTRVFNRIGKLGTWLVCCSKDI